MAMVSKAATKPTEMRVDMGRRRQVCEMSNEVGALSKLGAMRMVLYFETG
jgi:hypothetical protein